MLKKSILIFFVTFLFIESYPLQSKADECKDFEKAIIAKDAESDGHEKRNDIGLFFDYEWKKNQKILAIKRNENDYPIIRLSFLENKIPSGSIIKSINGINLSEVNDNEIIKLQKSSTKTNLEIFGISEQITIEPKEYELLNFNIDFNINSIIEINTMEGFFELDYIYWSIYKRNDWTDEGKIIGTDITCSFKDSTYEDIQNPQDTIELLQFNKNQDEIYEAQYFSVSKITKDVESTYQINGKSSIRSDFDFEKFPFDTQKLLIRVETFGDINLEPEIESKPYLYLLTPDKNTFLSAERYKEQNYLKEWKIIDYEVTNFYKSENIYSAINPENLINYKTDNLDIILTVERHYKYYLYKIIIPVFLILLIAWSVLWIPAHRIEERLTTSIVSLLALIAYNFVFQDEIPKLNILTSLDKFILLSYLFCSVPIFMTIFLSRFVTTNQKRAYLFNRRMRMWGGIIYIVTNFQIFYL